MTTRQAPARTCPARGRSEFVHFTGGECMACGNDGSWRTANTRLVTCPECRQTGTYREALARLRDPIEVCSDKEEAYGARLDFWISKLRTGKIGQTGLHRRYGIQPRQIRTATGPAWGLFAVPFDEGGIEYVPPPAAVRDTVKI